MKFTKGIATPQGSIGAYLTQVYDTFGSLSGNQMQNKNLIEIRYGII